MSKLLCPEKSSKQIRAQLNRLCNHIVNLPAYTVKFSFSKLTYIENNSVEMRSLETREPVN